MNTNKYYWNNSKYYLVCSEFHNLKVGDIIIRTDEPSEFVGYCSIRHPKRPFKGDISIIQLNYIARELTEEELRTYLLENL